MNDRLHFPKIIGIMLQYGKAATFAYEKGTRRDITQEFYFFIPLTLILYEFYVTRLRFQ